MRRKTIKLISCVLAAVLLFAVPISPAQADSSSLCFLAVNDNPVLSISYMPYYIGGRAYVRCDVFRDYFGISYDYFASSNAAMLYSGGTQIIFYLNDGTCYDGNGVDYPISATIQGGVVYVPAQTGQFFGITSSSISGTGTGDLLRMKDGRQVLSDKDYIDASASTILQRYQEYTGGSVNPPSSPSPEVSESPELNGAQVYLCFVGMPSAELMDALKDYSMSAAFFITADEARDNPDMVRRIAGEGSTVGVYCESEPETVCAEAARAIQEAAFFLPTIMTSSEPDSSEHRQYAAENGYVFYSPSYIIAAETRNSAAITDRLPKTQRKSDFCLFSGDNAQALLPSVLRHLSTNGYVATALLETSL